MYSTYLMHLIGLMLSVAMMISSMNSEKLYIPKRFGIRGGREESLNGKTVNRSTTGQTLVPIACRYR